MISLLRTFKHNECGNISILFAFLLVPILGFMALAVDMSRAYSTRAQLQQALDAAALAGGRHYLLASRDTEVAAYFNANLQEHYQGATYSPVTISANDITGTLTVSATADVPTTFAQVLGYDNIPVAASVDVVRNDTTLEVALVIDTTGSMNSNDSSGAHKMTSAKDAANLLLNILYNNQDTDDKIFLSVVPFVQNVNVGNNYSSWLEAGSESSIPWNSGPYPSASGWRGCMVERLDNAGHVVYASTDDPPSVQRFMPYADHYFGPNCPAWTSGEKGIVPGICRMSNSKIYAATTSGTTGASAPSHGSSTASDGAVTWNYIRPAYSGVGNNPVNCPLWRRGESVASGECRMAPNCPNWATGESISIGDCRTANSKLYTATTSGTTSGAAAPSHAAGTVVSGGISWQYRAASYVGVGGNMYTASSSGTTGGTTPLHTSGSASDGGVNWTLWHRMWVGGQAISATTNNVTYQRINPWYLVYRPTTTGTTSGSTPPTHNSGSVASGGITWSYSSDMTAQVRTASSNQYGLGYNSGCGSSISPMSDSRLTAKAKVDALQPSTGYGGTMTPMGLVWGWRTISPQWRGLWANVPAEHPFDYNHDDNYKAVIILTDGENVFTQCGGTYCRGSATPFGYLADGRLGTTDSPTAVDTLDTKVTEVCDHIRATGTLIYAVMFDLPAGASSTRTLFQNCVGEPEHFFDAVNATELQSAFQNIATDLSRLRLSK